MEQYESGSPLICGINPFVIARVTVSNRIRIGPHPIKLLLRRRKLEKFFFSNSQRKSAFSDFFVRVLSPIPNFADAFYPVTVNILGANGNIIKYYSCKSMKEAYDRKEMIEAKLEKFLESMKNKE